MSPPSAHLPRPRAGLRLVGAAGWLGVLGLVYFWPLLRSVAPRSLGSDFAAQTYPWGLYASRRLHEGRLPHWAPEVGFGFPFLADIETVVFYPVSLLVSWLTGPEVPYRALEVQAIAHHLIGGLGMFVLLRRAAQRGVAALVGATTFAFSGFLWAHAAHLTVVQSASWGPWVLVGGEALVRRPGGPAIALTAGAVALAILGGHPQIPYYIALALAVLVAAALVTRRRDDRDAAPPPVAFRAIALAGVLGIGLTALQILPTAVLTRESVRWRATTNFLSEGILPPEHLLSLAIPLVFHGTPRWSDVDEFFGAVGLLPLVLAGWALVRRPTRWTLTFTALVVLGLAVALRVPGSLWIGSAGTFRIPARALYLVTVGLAGLAGLGAGALLEGGRPWTRPERRLVAGVGLAAAAALAAGAWLGRQGLPPGWEGQVSPVVAWHLAGTGLLLLAALLVLILARTFRRPAALVPVVLLAAVATEVLSFPRELAWSPVPPDGHWPPSAEARAVAGRLGPHRLLNDRIFRRAPTMEANVGLIYGIRLPSLYTSLFPWRYQEARALLFPELPATANLYDLMGVQLVASRRAVPVETVGPRAADTPGHDHDWPALRIRAVGPALWEVRDAVPRVTLPDRVVVLHDRHRVLAALPAIDPRRTALFERTPLLCPPRTLAGGPPPTAAFLLDDPDHVRLRVTTADTRALVLADSAYPGWQATVDGVPAPIYRANYLFRAVCVPRGEHVVAFRFRQPGFAAGLALTGLSAALAVAVAVRPGARLARRLIEGRRRRVAKPAAGVATSEAGAAPGGPVAAGARLRGRGAAGPASRGASRPGG